MAVNVTRINLSPAPKSCRTQSMRDRIHHLHADINRNGRKLAEASFSDADRRLINYVLLHEVDAVLLADTLVVVRRSLDPLLRRDGRAVELNVDQTRYVDYGIWPAVLHRCQSMEADGRLTIHMIAFLIDRLLLSHRCREQCSQNAAFLGFLQRTMIAGEREAKIKLDYTLRQLYRPAVWEQLARIDKYLQDHAYRAGIRAFELFESTELHTSQWSWTMLAYALRLAVNEPPVLATLVRRALRRRLGGVNVGDTGFELYRNHMLHVLRGNAWLVCGPDAPVNVKSLRQFLLLAFVNPAKMWAYVVAVEWRPVLLVRVCQALLEQLQLPANRTHLVGLIVRARRLGNIFLRNYLLRMLKNAYIVCSPGNGDKRAAERRQMQIEYTDLFFTTSLFQDSWLTKRQHCLWMDKVSHKMMGSEDSLLTKSSSGEISADSGPCRKHHKKRKGVGSHRRATPDNQSLMLNAVKAEVADILLHKYPRLQQAFDDAKIAKINLDIYDATQSLFASRAIGDWLSKEMRWLELTTLSLSPFYEFTTRLVRNVSMVRLLRTADFTWKLVEPLNRDHTQLAIDVLIARFDDVQPKLWPNIFELLLGLSIHYRTDEVMPVDERRERDLLLVSIMFLAEKVATQRPQWFELGEFLGKLLASANNHLVNYLIVRHCERYTETSCAADIMQTDFMFQALTQVSLVEESMVQEIDMCDELYAANFPEECAVERSTRLSALYMLQKTYTHYQQHAALDRPEENEFHKIKDRLYDSLMNRNECPTEGSLMDSKDELRDTTCQQLRIMQAIAIMCQVDRDCDDKLIELLFSDHLMPATSAMVVCLISSLIPDDCLPSVVGFAQSPLVRENLIWTMLYKILLPASRNDENHEAIRHQYIRLILVWTMCAERDTQLLALIALDHLFVKLSAELSEWTDIAYAVRTALHQDHEATLVESIEADLRFALCGFTTFTPLCWLHDIPQMFGMGALDVQPSSLVLQRFEEFAEPTVAEFRYFGRPAEDVLADDMQSRLNLRFKDSRQEFDRMFSRYKSLCTPRDTEPRPELLLMATSIKQVDMMGLLAEITVPVEVAELLRSVLGVDEDAERVRISKAAQNWLHLDPSDEVDLVEYVRRKRGEGFQIVLVENPRRKTDQGRKCWITFLPFARKCFLLYCRNEDLLTSSLYRLTHYVAILPDGVQEDNIATDSLFVWEYARQMRSAMFGMIPQIEEQAESELYGSNESLQSGSYLVQKFVRYSEVD